MAPTNIIEASLSLQASERELNWVLRIAVIAVSILSTLVALTVSSVYYLS